jgi:hypothetical protein
VRSRGLAGFDNTLYITPETHRLAGSAAVSFWNAPHTCLCHFFVNQEAYNTHHVALPKKVFATGKFTVSIMEA